MFEFNTSEYSVTTYNKEGVAEANNSNVILSNITVENLNGKYAITDKISITNQSIENVNSGLQEKENFDLSMKQYITKAIVNIDGLIWKFDIFAIG